MHRPNAQHLTLGHLVPPTSSDMLISPTTPSPGTPASFHTPISILGTPATLRRAISDEDTKQHVSQYPLSSPSLTPGFGHVPYQLSMQDAPLDPAQAALIQSARDKVSLRDQEAMRKLRSTMMEHSLSDSASSSHSASPSSPRFPPGTGQTGGRVLRTRRSTLSKAVMPEHEEEGPSEDVRIAVAEVPMKRGQSQPALSRDYTLPVPQASPAGIADHVIAVLGHQGVGKTTVIARALRSWGMSNPVKIPSSSGHIISSCYSQITPGGKLKISCKVEFLEINISSLDLASDAHSLWPVSIPKVTGVICCYDALRKETLDGFKDCLERLSATNIPTVLLACKSDPDETLQVDASYGNSMGEPFNMGLVEVTTKTQEGKMKMRNALRWLLYKLEQRNRRQMRPVATLNITQTLSYGSTSNASSDVRTSLSTMETLASPDSDGESVQKQLMWRHNMSRSPRTSEDVGGADAEEVIEILEEPKAGQGDETAGREENDKRLISGSLGWLARPEETLEADKKMAGEKMTRGDTNMSNASGDPPVYMSQDDLFDRLFTSIVSSQDDNLTRSFFMTYRRFCLPQELLAEFVERFREVEGYAVSSDVKNWTLMKLTGALIDWTTRYPGDLSSRSTEAQFASLISHLLQYNFMAHLLSDLVSVQQNLSQYPDIDQSWSLKKDKVVSARMSNGSTASTDLVIDTDVLYDIDHIDAADKAESQGSVGRKAGSSHHSASTSSPAMEEPRHPLSNPDTQRNNNNFDRTPSVSSMQSISRVNKARGKLDVAQISDDQAEIRWGHAVDMVLRLDPKIFAAELTKMQWELFASIRPRDVFRHDFGKETEGPVGKSIIFFNHISRWVSTIILAGLKPKHRARLIERFILIAHQLRRLNNYDSLYAVISGLRETSVHRLSVTQGMVTISPGTEKDWQSHLKLMDPRGGYVHYRRALQADISHGRGAIPLLTNIIGLVARLQAVRREDIRKEDKKIQWDKFLRFGEILGTIQECQGWGPLVSGSVGTAFKSVIENTVIMTDEDSLWERSQSLESSGGTMGGKMLKRLANLGF